MGEKHIYPDFEQLQHIFNIWIEWKSNTSAIVFSLDHDWLEEFSEQSTATTIFLFFFL